MQKSKFKSKNFTGNCRTILLPPGKPGKRSFTFEFLLLTSHLKTEKAVPKIFRTAFIMM